MSQHQVTQTPRTCAPVTRTTNAEQPFPPTEPDKHLQ